MSPRGKGGSVAESNGRRRTRARRKRRCAAIVTAIVLMLALTGMGLWLVFLQRPETTVQVYPMTYEAEIREGAASNGLDPALPAAVILAESSYQPEAVSEANAQGLMQLLPSTAEWVAGKFGETYREGSLFEPDTNIKYGCWYLGYLIRRFEGTRHALENIRRQAEEIGELTEGRAQGLAQEIVREIEQLEE